MAPFGYGNPEPVVGMRGFTLRNPAVVNSRHLRFHLAWDGGEPVEAYAWDRSEWEVESAARYDIAFMPQLSNTGEPRFQIRVLDLMHAETA
jgi:single-stranded-DNA-specific exonuclease